MKTSVKVLFGLAAVSAVIVIGLVAIMATTKATYGATPTDTGWSALLLSLLSTSGFSVVGAVTWLVQKYRPGTTTDQVAEVVELSQSFAAFMADKTNRAAQRRLLFAAADEFRNLPGVEVSHDAGVLIVKYSGYIDAKTA